MAGHYATPEADITITQHLPPPEDDSTQNVSMSFVIPPQADSDTSNLLDQDCDDFFAGPGLVTLSTPVLPRHLTNTRLPVRKVTGTIQTPAVVSGPILGQTLPTHSTTELELPDDRAEPPETHILPHPLRSPSPPTKPFTLLGPTPTASAVDGTSITDPDPPRPIDMLSEGDPGVKICDGLKSNKAPPMASIITAKATDRQPNIQSMPTSGPPHHSTATQNTQISRQLRKPAPQKKNTGPAHSHGTAGARPTQAMSKPRSGAILDCEITSTQSRIGGGAAKTPKSTLSNREIGRVKGRIESDPASSNSRSNLECHAPPTGNEHSDRDSLGDPTESYGAVTQGLVITVLPPSESSQSRFCLISDRAGLSDPSPSVDPPQVAEDHAGAKINQDIVEEERKDDDRPTVSQLSPSKTVRECRYDSEGSDWSDKGIQPSPAPTPRASLAASPMRPSRKRVASAGHESDTEPGSAWPGEWEKQSLITESNREGEVRGGEGKEDQQARRVSYGKKRRPLPQPSHKENGVASSSLTLTRRLKARAVRESPRARKLRDKLAGRVGVGGGVGRRRGFGTRDVSRGGHAALDTCGFPENVGASATTSVATAEGKGSDRALSGETTRPRMPYSGDNQERGGAINRHAGSVVGGPYFRSTLKRSTVPVEFRFELAGRMGTSRGSAEKENPGPRASRSNREGERGWAAASSRKRPKLGELGGAKDGVGGLEESPSSQLNEAKDDQGASHAGAWKGKTCSGSNNTSATSIGRSKRAPLIIPEAFRFSTEQRAKEREKFDEAMRVKQKEKERRSEEERAARAVEEERGVREMRKRAVPKANTVPEWYATMPKRKAA